MKKDYKIVVVGLGYVGLSNAVLLAQHNTVIGVDISQERVDAINERKSPINDAELSEFLVEKDLNLSASTDLAASIEGADYVIVSTPTNYDERTNFFDTSSVETVISLVTECDSSACIIVKSTIPVGFIEDLRVRLDTDAVFFSPEFLREGRALYDNLHPSRIIMGEKSQRAKTFAKLLVQGALKPDVDLLFTNAREAEAIKLFSNTYLAMRVAFFNELDSYALSHEMNSLDIITGVSLDPRIGNNYNNPSFGFGGYCLPKDVKQLLTQMQLVPHDIVASTIQANISRKKFIADVIISNSPRTVGIYKLGMKKGSDNFRDAAIFDIIWYLKAAKINVIIYDLELATDLDSDLKIEKNIFKFKKSSNIIVTNRMEETLEDVREKVFCRDLFNRD